MSGWSYNPPVGQPGSVNQGGGGGSMSTSYVRYRDALDARRSGAGQIPQAAYPDGYLGTIVDRRQDKLLGAVQNKLTNRSYQRGVHKGERVDPRDYYWTPEVNPQLGIEYEARGLKWTQQGSPAERLAHMGKNAITSPEEVDALARQYGVDPGMREQQIDPVRSARMKRLLPTWAT